MIAFVSLMLRLKEQVLTLRDEYSSFSTTLTLNFKRSNGTVERIWVTNLANEDCTA